MRRPGLSLLRPESAPRTSTRKEAARRNRRLFLEQLENRALLAVVGMPDLYETLEDAPLYITVAGVPGSEPGEFLMKPGVLHNDLGESLWAEKLADPVYGEITFHADGSFEYLSHVDFYVVDSFTYRVTDGVDIDGPITVNIEVTPVNDPPLAAADSYTVSKNATLTVGSPGVLDNDLDTDSATLTAAFVSGPAHGTLTLNSDGSFIYTPETNYVGPDSFSYAASDGELSDATDVSLTIVDLPPTTPTKAYTLFENSPLTVSTADGLLDGASDPDDPGLTLFVVLVAGPSHGDLDLNPDGSFTYDPAPNYFGPDTFSIQIGNGVVLADAVGVGLNVLKVNRAPIAVDDELTVDEDSSASGNVLGNDYDPDNTGPLTASLVSGVSYGVLVFNANGNFTYTPSLNFHGTDIFTYIAIDGGQLPQPTLPIGFTGSDFITLVIGGGSGGSGGGTSGDPITSNVATVTINITPINDPPIAVDDGYSLDENTVFWISAPGILGNDSDPDNDSLTAVMISGPQNGSLSSNADGSLTYTPYTSFTGADSFTYVVNDGTLDSAPATVTLTVVSVNHAPLAADDYFTLDEDSSVSGSVLGNDSDPDNDPFIVTGGSGSQYASLTLNSDGSFTYIPNANFFGSDSFSYTISDGSLTATATVYLTINSINDPPVASDHNYSVAEDSQLLVYGGLLEGASDPDTDAWSLWPTVVSSPAHGYVEISSYGSFVYTPNPDFSGSDSFTFQINDGSNYSNIATVTIEVSPVNDPPTAVDDSFVLDEDALYFSGYVMSNDSDIDGSYLSVSLASGVSNGNLIMNADGSFNYTPNQNYFGSDSFTYYLSDNAGGSSTATVSLSILAVNDAPIAVDDTFIGDEDTPGFGGSVTYNDLDPDNETYFSAMLQTGPSHGTLQLDYNGSFVYWPAANYFGTDSFTYVVFDSSNVMSNVATVTLTVNPINDAPSAGNQSYSLDEDTALTIDAANGLLVGATDPDGDTLSVTIIDQPGHGQLTSDGAGGFTYTPNANYHGSDSFFFAISDGSLIATATASLTINSVNDAPVAEADEYTLDEDALFFTANVLGNDTDIDGPSSLSALLVSNVANGNLILNSDGSFNYTPNANYFGLDSFTYQAYDGLDYSNIVPVVLIVNPINDAPTAQDQSFTLDEDTTLIISSFDLLAGATDPEGDPLSITIIDQPLHGTLTPDNSGGYVYTPNANYFGTDSFFFGVSDGSLLATATAYLTITAVNDAPVAELDEYETDEDVSLSENVLANDHDVEGDSLTANLVSSPLHGAVSLSPNGDFTYVPNENYVGVDLFSYSVSDGNGGVAETYVLITVFEANDLPVAVDDIFEAQLNELSNEYEVSISSAEILANDTDSDGDSLQVTYVSGPENGTLYLDSSGTFHYSATPGSGDTDGFWYRATDSYGSGNLAFVGISKGSAKPTVTVAATVPTADEVKQRKGKFTVSRTGSTDASLTVVVEFGGTARKAPPNDDYDASNVNLSSVLSWVMTIPQGSPSAEIEITPEYDSLKEGDETVILSIGQYSLSETPYLTNGSNSATVTIKDGWGRVTIEASGATSIAEDSGGSMPFTISFWGRSEIDAGDSIRVALQITGSATIGPSIPFYATRQAHGTAQDYFIDDGYLISQPNLVAVELNSVASSFDPFTYQMKRTLYVYPTADGHVESDEIVSIKIASAVIDRPVSASEGDENCIVDKLKKVDLTIVNDDTPATITVTRIASAIPEGPNNFDLTNPSAFFNEATDAFTVSRSGPTTYPLTVPISYSGSASLGQDYKTASQQLAKVVNFAVGQASVTLRIASIKDRLPEEDEDVTLTATATTDTTVNPSAGSASLTITDNDQPGSEWVAIDANPPGFGPPTYTEWTWEPMLDYNQDPPVEVGGYWARTKRYKQYEVASTIQDGTTAPNQPIENKDYTYELSPTQQVQIGVSAILSVSYQYAFGSDASHPDWVNSEIVGNAAAPGEGWVLGYGWLVATEYAFDQRIVAPGPSETVSTPLGLSAGQLSGAAGDAYVDQVTLLGSGFTGANVKFYKRQVPQP